MRYGLSEDGLDSLQWGITGEKPQPQPISTSDITPNQRQKKAGRVPDARFASGHQSYGASKEVTFTVVLVGTITENDQSTVAGLLARLRDISQDAGLTLVRIERGSTRLVLEGRLDGFERMHQEYRSGQTTEILGLPIISIRRRKLVILIHGIRTRAEWQSQVRCLLEEDHDVAVVPILYGYFSLLKFLIPFASSRGSAIAEIERKLRFVLRDNSAGNPEILILAHSFGTYSIARILREEPDIEIDRLLLCGSIIAQNFKWEALPNCPPHVLNEVGTKDIWPILASMATWGYGKTGTFGFGAPRVRDRFHDIGHSGFFQREFVERYWLPWVRNDEIITSKFEYQRPPTPLFIWIAEFIPLKQSIAVGVGLAGSFAGPLLLHNIRPLSSWLDGIARMLLGGQY